MRITDIGDYTLKDLLTIAEEDYGLASFPNAKISTKPNKTEVAALINEVDRTFRNEQLQADKTVLGSKEDKQSKKRSRKRELTQLKRVQITRLRKTGSYQNDDSNRVEFITWGNAEIGMNTNKVVFDTPWFLPVGCIKNLENVIYQKVDNKRTQIAQVGVPKPAFKIDYLGMPTEAELKAIADRQALRASQG